MPQKYGYEANAAESVQTDMPRPCRVCDDERPTYSWTDLSYEGYCVRCGTPYQLQGGTLKEGETYPRMNTSEEALPMLRHYWKDTQRGNGCGRFMLFDIYPDQLEDRQHFNAWCRKHEKEYPHLFTKSEPKQEGQG